MNDRHTAPIKPQYIIQVPKNFKLTQNPTKPDDTKNERGQNKPNFRSKRSEMKLLQSSGKLCYSFHDKRSNLYKDCIGKDCKFQHDLKTFLKNKLEDIKTFESCPNVETFGFCQNGFQCRLLNSHLKYNDNKQPQLCFEDAKGNPLPSKTYSDFYQNQMPIGLTKKLRTKKIKFTQTPLAKKFTQE